MPLFNPTLPGPILKTGQTTQYFVGDDATLLKGLAKQYQVQTTGSQSGTTTVKSPHYAAATIAFVAATKLITDSNNGLASVKTGDTISVPTSPLNGALTLTVKTGNVAGQIEVNEAITDEAAGAYVTICKHVAPSNNTVYDQNTGLTWRRYTTLGEKCGLASDGKLNWYDADKRCTLHPAAADLQMIAGASPILRIVGGAGEIGRYFAGMVLALSGFTNAVNNLLGPVVSAVAVNGADLDITLNVFNPGLDGAKITLISEAAAGSRAITVVCQSIFSYIAMMNVAGLAGYMDWRVCNRKEIESLFGEEADSPDITAFPSWPVVAGAYNLWTSTTTKGDTTSALIVYSASHIWESNKTYVCHCALVRGG